MSAAAAAIQRRRALIKDYGTEALVCGLLGIVCLPVGLFGIYSGIQAVRGLTLHPVQGAIGLSLCILWAIGSVVAIALVAAGPQ